MSSPLKKIDDNRLIALNSIGISLRGIAKRLGVHHTTVSLRLKELYIDPANTRRAFMEDIYNKLSPDQQDWLEQQLVGRPVKDLVRSLIVNEYVSNQGKKP